MGEYYKLGVIQECRFESKKSLSEEAWRQLLNERIDLELFEVEFTPKQVDAVLKGKIFEDNIEDFYCKLKKITNDGDVDVYFKEYGTEPDNYDWDQTDVYFEDDAKITMHVCKCIPLFAEGKVMAETFSIEPKLINWLFRHCDVGNCLSGAIISTLN